MDTEGIFDGPLIGGRILSRKNIEGIKTGGHREFV